MVVLSANTDLHHGAGVKRHPRDRVAMSPLATAVKWLSILGFFLTALLGLGYIITLMTQDWFGLTADRGFFSPPDINYNWSRVFSFRIDTILYTWAPLIVGLAGLGWHFKNLHARRGGSWTSHPGLLCLAHVVMCLFLNFPYASLSGIIVGSINGAIGLVMGLAFVYAMMTNTRDAHEPVTSRSTADPLGPPATRPYADETGVHTLAQP